MDDQRSLDGTNQSAEFTTMDSSPVQLLDLKTDDALETTFPSVTCNQKRRLLKDLNDRCTETIEFLATRYDMLRALDALVDEIEQATAPVNGAQPDRLEMWIAETELDSYPSGTRTPLAKLQEFILEQLENPNINQQDIRETLLHYAQAVEYEHSG
jgi:hypothetical protein